MTAMNAGVKFKDADLVGSLPDCDWASLQTSQVEVVIRLNLRKLLSDQVTATLKQWIDAA